MTAWARQDDRRAPTLDHPPVERLRPMLPTLVEEPFDSPDYIFELKWGGVRAIAEVDRGRVRLHGGNLRDLTPLYPELSALAGCLRGGRAVIDGEIIAWGTERLPSFELLRPRLLRPQTPVSPRRRSPIIYQAFDLLELDGRWLLERPLFERRNLLHQRLMPQGAVNVVDFISEDGVAFFEAAAAHEMEGIVAKEKQSTYLPGQRTPAWKEVRALQVDDFVVGGYSFGGGRQKDLISSLLVGAYRDGRLEFVGQVSVGGTQREARLLLDLLTPLHTGECPFVEMPEVPRFLYWCRPELACRVRYGGLGPDGRLRFPLFVAPRPDVPPEECVRTSLPNDRR